MLDLLKTRFLCWGWPSAHISLTTINSAVSSRKRGLYGWYLDLQLIYCLVAANAQDQEDFVVV